MSIKNKIKTFFTMDDEYEYEYIEEEVTSTQPNQIRQTSSNVIDLKSVKASATKMVLYEPRTFDEAQQIADNIVSKRAVVINLQRVNHQDAKRIIDFLSGTIYAVNGVIQRIGAQTFLCAPDNMDITGSISETLEEDFNKGW
ncbi:cell division protein SepF [Ornithinibacillus bavariensis]|uniref:Cell division protein SepF n=1 Tax=Ornithinibacillus bavariensis TaxID=545502 RepID=A0A919X546_9BACI|nr:cell division protein SepF [Ornithinibacillus bavariensis]GIO26076.1 cell division protein SepF [Ornithinibacillus bavariensis]HAM82168.1 cell division protein SepF [Ornithinibacillus sp.]